MVANLTFKENEVVDSATAWLRAHVPKSWTVELRDREESAGTSPSGAALEVRSPGVSTTLTVEARRSLAPRDVAYMFGSLGRRLRTLSPNVPLLVVAPWLSARTRELLAAEEVNYIDLTGNALIRLENPALFVQAQGADRDPSPAPRAKARVRGQRAGRLIRTLVDVRPPYGVRRLAEASGLAPGYVSQLLTALDDDALVERGKRGRVESVDIASLLHRWIESYRVFTSNDTVSFLAPRGLERTLELLAGEAVARSTAITGSFAAVRIAPVAAPRLLVVYTDAVNALAPALELIPADPGAGANVALLRPFDPIVWQRTSEHDGLRYAAPAQVAADCMTGNGRMPAEGEAVLEWMLVNQASWRLDSLDERTTGPT